MILTAILTGRRALPYKGGVVLSDGEIASSDESHRYDTSEIIEILAGLITERPFFMAILGAL